MTTIAAPKTSAPRRRPRLRGSGWLPVAGLLLLSLVPIAAGAFRFTELTTGATVTADNARFFASPVPILAHIVGSSVFLVLGAFQFVPSLRRRRWHRYAGRVLLPAGLASALSGIWMAFGADLPASNGIALLVMRVGFGAVMVAGLVMAFVAVRRGDIPTHRAWMMRAYAIGMGAGTQVLMFLPWTIAFGAPDVATHAVLMGAGWVINLAVAEVVIRRARRCRGGARPARRRAAAPIMSA
ncbi:DUF2306 domain-containing protein [Agromyces sp. NPDC056523]|uniref:DUF2306 domain-containing protein n=1 Tax=Agromyces sp. NPDC056523 TaxID=3345850 RepID=UPI00366F0EA9